MQIEREIEDSDCKFRFHIHVIRDNCSPPKTVDFIWTDNPVIVCEGKEYAIPIEQRRHDGHAVRISTADVTEEVMNSVLQEAIDRLERDGFDVSKVRQDVKATDQK